MENCLLNPGLAHIGRKILSHLNFQTLKTLRQVSPKWKDHIDYEYQDLIHKFDGVRFVGDYIVYEDYYIPGFNHWINNKSWNSVLYQFITFERLPALQKFSTFLEKYCDESKHYTNYPNFKQLIINEDVDSLKLLLKSNFFCERYFASEVFKLALNHGKISIIRFFLRNYVVINIEFSMREILRELETGEVLWSGNDKIVDEIVELVLDFFKSREIIIMDYYCALMTAAQICNAKIFQTMLITCLEEAYNIDGELLYANVIDTRNELQEKLRILKNFGFNYEEYSDYSDME